MKIVPFLVVTALLAGCGGANSAAGSTPSIPPSTRTSAPTSAPTTDVPASTTPPASQPAPSSSSVSPAPSTTSTTITSTKKVTPEEAVPGLSPLAAKHIELKSAKKGKLAGLTGYYLTLSNGHMWAIKGTPQQVVPKVMALKSYNPNASGFFHSKPYVLYLPTLLDAPEAFIGFVGPRPGMTVIDTDVPLAGQ